MVKMQDKPETFEIIIVPGGGQKEYLKDFFRYWELFYFLAFKDILVRYKQAFFGIAWAVLRPIMFMGMFTLLFGKLANFPSEGINYSLFVLAGIIPWQFISNVIGETSSCLLNNPNLLSKVYFPRMIIPSSQIFAQLVDFGINLTLLLILVTFSGYLSLLTVFVMPFFVLLSIMLSLGVGLWLSACVVKYRDIRFLIPFVIQFGMYLTPVGYGSFMIAEKWQWLFFLNPLAGIIEGFRWVMFGVFPPYLMLSILLSFIVTMILLITGFFYFRSVEKTIADFI